MFHPDTNFSVSSSVFPRCGVGQCDCSVRAQRGDVRHLLRHVHHLSDCLVRLVRAQETLGERRWEGELLGQLSRGTGPMQIWARKNWHVRLTWNPLPPGPGRTHFPPANLAIIWKVFDHENCMKYDIFTWRLPSEYETPSCDRNNFGQIVVCLKYMIRSQLSKSCSAIILPLCLITNKLSVVYSTSTQSLELPSAPTAFVKYTALVRMSSANAQFGSSEYWMLLCNSLLFVVQRGLSSLQS